MQIKKIVLYGKNNEKRILDFHLGKLNIISGRSKTGKSAIGEIINYCLGGKSCKIPAGAIRNTTDWYGLLLEHNAEFLFIARKNPEKDQLSTSVCCYQQAISDIPENLENISLTDIENLEKFLSQKLGILENKFIPPSENSRYPFSINIRHSLYYCLQGQNEIASNKLLFHRQDEQFIPQAIKDTLPFFLGIINEHSLALQAEKNRLKKECQKIQKRISELEQLVGTGFERGVLLVEEAKFVGLLKEAEKVDIEDYESIHQALVDVEEAPETILSLTGMDEISKLQSQITTDEIALDEVRININNAKNFLEENKNYTEEILHQSNRLQTIGLLDSINFNSEICPICSAKAFSPSINDIKNSIIELSENLSTAKNKAPYILSYLEELQNKEQQLNDSIKFKRQEIDSIYKENKTAFELRDLQLRRSRVFGRISLWLESIALNNNSQIEYQALEKNKERINEIEKLLDKNIIKESKAHITNILSTKMTKWAEELELEHVGSPYRLDLDKLTVYVDTEDRPIPLEQLGSAANWLGCHLISLFALHKYFIQHKRPVPQFIFIDQPSQVYFPPEDRDEHVDREEVKRIYNFIQKRVEELIPNLQVIIVDHADLNEEFFKEAIIESWWDEDSALIPESWS